MHIVVNFDVHVHTSSVVVVSLFPGSGLVPRERSPVWYGRGSHLPGESTEGE